MEKERKFNLVCLSISAKGNRVIYKPAILTQGDLESNVDELVKKGFLEEVFEDSENRTKKAIDKTAEAIKEQAKIDAEKAIEAAKEAKEAAEQAAIEAKEAEELEAANAAKEAKEEGQQAETPVVKEAETKEEEASVSELLKRAREKAKAKAAKQ